jgi:hypothetical protein
VAENARSDWNDETRQLAPSLEQASQAQVKWARIEFSVIYAQNATAMGLVEAAFHRFGFLCCSSTPVPQSSDMCAREADREMEEWWRI